MNNKTMAVLTFAAFATALWLGIGPSSVSETPAPPELAERAQPAESQQGEPALESAAEGADDATLLQQLALQHAVLGGAGSGADTPLEIVRGGALDATPLLEARFESEAPSVRWSSVSDAIRSVYAAPDLPDVRLVSAECRETLCRTEMSVPEMPVAALREIGRLASADAMLSQTEGRHRLEPGRVIIYTTPPGERIDALLAQLSR